MSEKLIKPYEISVWEDRLIQNGNEYKFIENKLAVIGSNEMTGLNRVYDPVFNKKANGERTLTFSLKYKYFDPYIGNDEIINPFVSLLTNERKVKLHYDNKWYEFIVKEHTESSEDFEWTYTCDDAFVLELSKNGYNLTFDTELNNNQGTAIELAKKTLKDTNWKVSDDSDSLIQLISEPIYKATLVSTSDVEIINASNTDEPIPSAGSNIYLFYTYVKNQNGKNVQFIIRDNNRKYTIDDTNVITDTNFRITTELFFKNDHFENEAGVTIISFGEAETKYQANRLAYGQLTTYDPVMERTVDRFGITNHPETEVYKYTDYVYTTSNVIMNYFTNGDNFNALEDGSLQGWNPYVEFEEGKDVKKLELITRPEIGEGKALVNTASLSQIEGFLKAYFPGALNSKYQNTIFNSGFENNASFIKSVSVKEKFVFRWRAGQGELDSLTPATDLRVLVAKYNQDTPTFGRYYKHIRPDDIIIDFNTGTPKEYNNYITGGILRESETAGKYNYVIDDVVQTPSVKYIYINSTDDKEYVWNGLSGTFEQRTENNYLPYYYLVAEAKQGLPNTVLEDTSEKIGIFIYNTTGEGTYYIEDIQLTRFVADPTGETPVLIGNVPTATSQSTDYYYIKPKDGTAAEDVVKYVDLKELASEFGVNEDDIYPIYNKNSEKNLSISVSKSNCFDILQTIAETFECWIDLVVDHDEKGYITYDENGNPEKYVFLREFAGGDNWAGFKYGINLNSIEREVDSTEFVTKLIVEQSQSDYVDEGFVSIASARSNISGESYILNFDYYYNQNLLNREETEADKLNFINEIVKINRQLEEKEKMRRDLENSLIGIGSKRNTYTDLVDTARDNKTDALGRFEKLTNRTYEDYQQLQTNSTTIEYQNNFYIPTEDTSVEDKKSYYIYENEEMSLVDITANINPKALGYYELLPDYTKEETIADLVGQIYVASAIINNYSGILTNIEKEYWKIRKELRGLETYNVKIWVGVDDLERRHVFVELNDYLPGFSFEIDGSTYESTVSKKFFDVESDSHNISFFVPQDYTIEQSTYEIVDSKVVVFSITPKEERDGIATQVDKLISQKEEIIKKFNNKYSRFIQEGTWSSTDYIDSELYYLDALQVSNTSAQPKISYTINVVEVSELEGLEWYSFDAGEKTYIEDTEFFGWADVNGILTPAREEVIVSEVEWHLEEPDKNTIVVQNYKTRFEDFFQRISATVQTVEYNEATYAKTSSLLDTNGTINQNVLLDSLSNISGKEYALTSDGSVAIKDDVILAQNLTNLSNRVIINNEGIRVSSDGGETYTTVIDGQGLNIGPAYTGTFNTNEIIIGSSQNPSFRWDKSGISAFKLDEADTSAPYDLQTFVRYDQYGLYGIKNNETFKANNLQDVLDNAHFAVTWDGFFIKNSYPGGGRVEITSDNDFRVMNIPESQNTEQEKIKIGALEWGKDGQGNPITTPDAPGATYAPTLYGIRIKNNNGDTVMKTGDDGNLEITGTIYANGGDFSGLVTVGKDENDNSKPYITIDGQNSLIKSSNYQDGAGYGWMINKDGDAVFNNITARGAIKTAVFEYAEIQAVGGIFIFRPSSTIRSAAINETTSTNLDITVEKPYLFQVGDWCKVSNYTTDGSEPNATNILLTNGLTHVYEVAAVSGNGRVITLKNAAAMVTGPNAITDLASLEGGALVDMGNKANGDGKVGTSNYGIGVNSSDNTVNLPRRAISLFETVIDETKNPKVTYNYRGILGTLPTLPATEVSDTIYNNQMAGTQGIYTDNMYIGDKNQYLAFYTDNNGNKHLKISAKEMVFGYDEDTGEEITWEDKINDATQGSDAAQVVLTSTIGDQLVDGVGQGAVYARLYMGKKEEDSLKTFVFTATPPDSGSYYYHLDAINKTCTLKKKVNGVWIDAPSEDQPKYNYVWTFRDESGQPIQYNGHDSITGKAIYIDGDIVNNKIVLQCDVNDFS